VVEHERMGGTSQKAQCFSGFWVPWQNNTWTAESLLWRQADS